MLFDDPGIRARLDALISRLTTDIELRKDLAQEAELHRWLEGALHPGRSEFWHCNNCLLHLRNFFRRGHSLDSRKRRGGRSSIADESGGPCGEGHHLEPHDSFLEELMAEEDLVRLSKQLKPIDRKILADLIDGFVVREIAQRQHISRRAVNLHRILIAATALQADILPSIPSL